MSKEDIVNRLNEMIGDDPLLDYDAAVALLQDSFPRRNVRADILEVLSEFIQSEGIDRKQVEAWNRELHRKRKAPKRKSSGGGNSSQRQFRIERVRNQTRKRAGEYAERLVSCVRGNFQDSIPDVLRYVLNGISSREWRDDPLLSDLRVEFGRDRNKLFRKEVRVILSDTFSDLIRNGEEVPW